MRIFRQEFRVKETFFVLGNGWMHLFEWMCCRFWMEKFDRYLRFAEKFLAEAAELRLLGQARTS